MAPTSTSVSNVWLMITVALAVLCVLQYRQQQPQADCPTTDKAKDELSELDRHWQQRVYGYQQAERQRMLNDSNLPGSDHIYMIVPSIECASKVRLGNVRDGGKWMCRPWLAPDHCVAYSFGVGMDTSWERELIAMKPNCHTFSVDPNPNCGDLFPKDPRFTFRAHLLGATPNATDVRGNRTNFEGIRSQFGHTRLDFLKVDIEHGEFDVFPQVLQNGTGPVIPICQIFVEVHQRDSGFEISELLRLFERAGYLLYAREILFCGVPCSEYSYIHRSCLADYALDEALVYPNMWYP